MRIVLASACALLFLTAGIARPDELSDLKNKIEALEQTTGALKNQLNDLEKKLKSQAKTVAKIKKRPSASKVVAAAMEKNVNIGGHFKLFMADYTEGDRNDLNQNNSLAAGINGLWLYFSKPLTDWVSMDVVPRISVTAGATPSLGADIHRPSSASVDIDLDEAYMTLRLPYEVEMRAGAFYPYFSEEYASKSWWHEQYHGNNGLITLENWQSTGVELYKNIDFEDFSLPIYLYPFLNGLNRGRSNDSRFTDNNGDKNILVHMAPEAYLHGGRVRLLGSLGWGKWDDEGDNDSMQYALGGDLSYKSVNISGEYLRKSRNDWPLSGGTLEDAVDEGWYAKLVYTFNPKWKTLVKYSDVNLFFPSSNSMLSDNYKTFSLAVNYWITEGSTIIPQVEFVDADRSDGSETLEYSRYTLGWRTTF